MGRKKLPTPLKYCENCGKKLERRPLSSGYEEPLFFFNQRKYCSQKCASIAIGKEKVKKATTSPKISRARARKSIPFAPCALCGKTGYTEVHHIDKNPLNNSPNNLIRLCKSCHAKQHRLRGLCCVCGEPVKGLHLCSRHYQQYKKCLKNGKEVPEYIIKALQKMQGT